MSAPITSLPGFEVVYTGGNCRALVRQVNGCDIVLTNQDGGHYPKADDWMAYLYPTNEDDPWGYGQDLAGFKSGMPNTTLEQAIAMLETLAVKL